MNPDEINHAVAKRLGWHGIYTSPFEREYLGTEVTNKTVLQIGEFEGRVRPIPNYCGDIRAAFEQVIPHIIGLHMGLFSVSLKADSVRSWVFGFSDFSNSKAPPVYYESEAETAPMAICLTFLKLTD